MRFLHFAFVAISLAVVFAACQKTPDDYQSEEGREYYPLAIGKYWVYEVDSTIYDPNGDTSVYTSKTFAKEAILDTLSDEAGNLLYKFERYERSADTLPWQVVKVFTASVQGQQLIRTEDNLRFIPLTFPLRKNKAWDGHVYFDPSLIVTVAGESLEMFKGWAYKLASVGEPLEVGGLQFPETATVREADNENLIELRTARAVYAKGVGLVYRELWILDTQCIEACDGQAWEEKAEKGFILQQKIISYN